MKDLPSKDVSELLMLRESMQRLENLSQSRFFQALLRPIGGGQRTGSTDTAPIDFIKTSKFVKTQINVIKTSL